MISLLKRLFAPSAVIRRLVGSWLTAAALEYILLKFSLKSLEKLDGIAEMSLLRVITVTALVFAALCALSAKKDHPRTERILIISAFVLLSVMSLIASFTLPFLFICLAVTALCIVYVFKGSNKSEPRVPDENPEKSKLWLGIAIGTSALFFIIVSAWTVCRVLAYLAPTYDFGIFAQMYESMRKTGIPVTTLERVTTMSHFKVHVSPVYYLLLPFYMLVPRPETLQVLQAAVIASAAIPMWKIAKHHGLSPMMRAFAVALLLFYPTMAGGAGYDLHENCFLAPFVLWMLYGMDRLSIPITAVFSLLTLSVKEDSAVYVAIAALWLILKCAVREKDKKKKRLGVILGASVLVFSVAYFFCTTSYLANVGDGVMSGRYRNFLYDGSDSLITVIKAVIMCPMKALYECVDADKLLFIFQTLMPLLGLPLITRKYDRFVLLIPYVLLNLMSDYPYQHSVFFQYTFASSAFLIYLAVVNLADLKLKQRYVKPAVLASAVVTTAVFFSVLIMPKVVNIVPYYLSNTEYFADQTANLKRIPKDASVTATCYYTTRLSDHDVLYDVYYATSEQLFSSDYVVLDKGLVNTYRKYARGKLSGYERLTAMLTERDYEVFHEAKCMIIYKKSEG